MLPLLKCIYIGIWFSIQIQDAVHEEGDLYVVIELEDAPFDRHLHAVHDVAILSYRIKLIQSNAVKMNKLGINNLFVIGNRNCNREGLRPV